MKVSKLAQRWRQLHGYADKGGVIVVFDGVVQGWVNELRDPQHWRPWCIAIDAHCNEFVATGGNASDGAQRWDKAERAEQPEVQHDCHCR